MPSGAGWAACCFWEGGEDPMRLQTLLMSAIVTTGLVLLTIFVLNRFAVTRGIVQAAFS